MSKRVDKKVEGENKQKAFSLSNNGPPPGKAKLLIDLDKVPPRAVATSQQRPVSPPPPPKK